MPKNVTITTAPRLHINSLKMQVEPGVVGGQGVGGIGVVLDGNPLTIDLKKSRKKGIHLYGFDEIYRENALRMATKVAEHYGITSGIDINVEHFFHSHIGMGLGTQIGLSIGIGMTQLMNIPARLREVASVTHRAGVSGIGYYGFSHGGLIVDGGFPMGPHSDKPHFGAHSANPPAFIGSYHMPSQRKIMVIAPKDSVVYMEGFDENALFERHTPVPIEDVGALCTATLMGIIPTLSELDNLHFYDYFARILPFGTKKIELELNKDAVTMLSKHLFEILALNWDRIGECSYGLNSTDPKLQSRRYVEPFASFIDHNDHELEQLFPRGKLPFIALSSLGPTMFTILTEPYHDVEYLLNETTKRLPNGWEARIFSAKDHSVDISYDDGPIITFDREGHLLNAGQLTSSGRLRALQLFALLRDSEVDIGAAGKLEYKVAEKINEFAGTATPTGIYNKYSFSKRHKFSPGQILVGKTDPYSNYRPVITVLDYFVDPNKGGTYVIKECLDVSNTGNESPGKKRITQYVQISKQWLEHDFKPLNNVTEKQALIWYESDSFKKSIK